MPRRTPRLFLLLLPCLAFSAAAAPRPRIGVAVFETVVTIPVGHACMGGGIKDAAEILDPLLAKGFVLSGEGVGEQPVVVCAVDFCQLNDDAFDLWRQTIAEAAGTSPQRVLLATVHQHDAPICDLKAQALLDAQGLSRSLCDPEFCRKAAGRVGRAVRQAAEATPRAVTHVGAGQAKVERIASNRRIEFPGRPPRWDRTSADRAFDAEPEGEVDPYLKTISLWDGDRPLVAWSCYAVHPMSAYGKGRVSADFVGQARARREADDPDVFQVYFTGCAGDTTAGKYNDGRPEDRSALAERLYRGMVAAWEATRRTPVDHVTFRCAALRLAPREGGDFDAAAMSRILSAASESRWRRNCAALGLSWRSRLDRPIDVPCIDFGPAQFMVMPAETFVGYQLAAQQMRPGSFVMVSGFGDGAPGYIPLAAHWKEGYDDGYSWAAPDTERAMTHAMREALGAPAGEAKE